MKKIFTIFLAAAMLVLSAAVLLSCQNGDGGKNPDVNGDVNDTDEDDGTTDKGIKIDADGDIAVDVGKTVSVKAVKIETGMQTSNVSWVSEDETIATVDSRGNVTGVSEGSVKITATTIDGKYSAFCTVTVTLRLSGVSLSYDYYDLEIGDGVKLEAIPVPENFVGATYKWMSSVPSVASVDENGNVKAHALGSTSIMVEAEPGGYVAICTVTVGKYADSIVFDSEEMTVNKGISFRLRYTMTPADATTKPHWKSSNEKVVTVNSGGVIDAKECGEAIITVTTTNGLEVSIKITVVSMLSGFEFVQDEYTLPKGSKTLPDLRFYPEDASNKNLIWTSSDENVIKVVDGKIHAISNGTATLSARSEEGEYSDSCIITVNNPLVSIKFDGQPDKNTGKYPPVQMQHTDTLKLSPIFTPLDADEISSLVWESSNPVVVSVSSDGTLTAHAMGSATITVSSLNGVTAQIDVTVTKKIYKVESIKLPSDKYYMNPGDLLSVSPIYIPEESAEDAKLYSIVSTNNFVAEWDEELGGLVAKTVGDCQIVVTVIAHDGTQIRCTVDISVVENGTSFDSEYESEIHAVRDTENKKISDAEAKIEALKDERVKVREKLGNETDPALIEAYNKRLGEIEDEITKAQEEKNAAEKRLSDAEAGLKDKYACVKEDLTYDPDKDPYPVTVSDDDLVKVSDYTSDITVDLRYSGTDNEIGEQVYTYTDAYLRYGTLKKLLAVAEQLKGNGYKIVIWDAYRPTTAQQLIWKAYGITDASFGAECSGSSLCITLVNADGTPLEMPSDFGDLSALSDRDYSDVSEDAHGAALMLQTQMGMNGFTAGNYWWQFTDTDIYEIEDEFLCDMVVDSVTEGVVTPPEPPISGGDDGNVG